MFTKEPDYEDLAVDVLEELQYTVRWQKHVQYDAHLHFIVYSNFGVDAENDRMNYRRAGFGGSIDLTEDLNEAEISFQGDIKWDGCADLDFGDEVQYHICGKGGAEAFAKLIVGLWIRASELMNWSPRNMG